MTNGSGKHSNSKKKAPARRAAGGGKKTASDLAREKLTKNLPQDRTANLVISEWPPSERSASGRPRSDPRLTVLRTGVVRTMLSYRLVADA